MKTRLSDFGDLTPAEETLRDAVQRGVWARVSDSVPDEPTPEVTIRASFIRYLAMGGCGACRTAAPGVQVRGAWVEGDGDPDWPTQGLYLDGADLCGDLYLVACNIPDAVFAYGARAKTIGFDRSRLATGLLADGLQTKGDVFLRATEVNGMIRLTGATIDGDVDLDRAVLGSEESDVALFADGVQTMGNFFLRRSRVTGRVRLLGSSVVGDLSCNGANIVVEGVGSALSGDRLQVSGSVTFGQAEVTGGISLVGARVGGEVSFEGARLQAKVPARALSASGLQARGTLFLRKGTLFEGLLDVTGASVAAINDDSDCWPMLGNLALNRFRYDAISGGPVDAERRLKWLALQDPSRFGEDFWPQPYEQLAKVFREMGHADDARRVLVEKERLLRADRRKRVRRDAPYAKLRFDRVWDAVLSLTAGYGHRPMRAVLWLFGFWLLGAMVFASAADREALKPNNAFVLRAPEWAACDPAYVQQTGGPRVRWSGAYSSQLACFLDQPEAAGYPIFNPFIYSADTLLPIVDLEMQANWIPDERHAPWIRYFLWFQIGMGWALSLLAVAGFSGLVKSD